MKAAAVKTAELVLDSELLYEAIDRERRHRRMNRAQVAAILGVTRGRYCQWTAGGGIGADVALRASVWLGRDLRDFAKPRAIAPPGSADAA